MTVDLRRRGSDCNIDVGGAGHGGAQLADFVSCMVDSDIVQVHRDEMQRSLSVVPGRERVADR